MKRRYVIGFFICSFVMICFLDLCFHTTYQISKKKVISQAKKNVKVEPNIRAEGQAIKNTGYYIKEENGFIIVYLSDEQTIFQYTTISYNDLPDEVRGEIKKGKRIQTAKELYAFLENYSS